MMVHFGQPVCRRLWSQAVSPSSSRIVGYRLQSPCRDTRNFRVWADASVRPPDNEGPRRGPRWMRQPHALFVRSMLPRGLLIGAAMSLASMQMSPIRSEARASVVSPSATSDSVPAVQDDSQKVSSTTGNTAPKAPGSLVMVSGGFIIPHPAKADKGGEDAYYIAKTGRSFGVADGVGGWADVGIDPGEFSRMLMRECRKASECEIDPDGGADVPAKILDAAFQRSRHITGDSGFMIVRDGKLIFESPPQQHSFNFPFQVGSYGDSVSSCEEFSIAVQPGDVLVAGSDGLLDNVFNQRSARLVWDAKKRGATPGVAAQQLATFAAARAKDPVYVSPFAKTARENGFYYQGGKVDDITVVVAYIISPGELEGAKPVSKL